MKNCHRVLLRFIYFTGLLFSLSLNALANSAHYQESALSPTIQNGKNKHAKMKPSIQPIAGIVFDLSFSKLARDFSLGFQQIWRNQPTPPLYSVTLKEEASALHGNKITIQHDDRVLYATTLNRRADNQDLGQSVAKMVVKKLRILQRNQISASPDLAEDEF